MNTIVAEDIPIEVKTFMGIAFVPVEYLQFLNETAKKNQELLNDISVAVDTMKQERQFYKQQYEALMNENIDLKRSISSRDR